MSEAPRADAATDARVRTSFAAQPAMALIGAEVVEVAPGAVTLGCAVRPELLQHTGVVHAGVLTMLADSACGYAALTLMPPGAEVLSVEFKVNLLRPAAGERLEARATVLKPGRTLTVVRADVVAIAADGSESLVAAMQGTMIAR